MKWLLHLHWLRGCWPRLLQIWHIQVPLKFAAVHTDKPNVSWRKVFIWDMTNTEVSGHNHEKYVWRSKGDSVKTKNTDINVKQGLLCCQWYWYIAQSGWNDDGGLPSHSSTSPQINSRWLKLGDSWMFQQDSDPKRTSELPTYAWRLSEIVTQNKTVSKFLYSYCIDDNA